MQIVVVPALGILLTVFLECIEANLSLDFRVTKIAASPGKVVMTNEYKICTKLITNCNVANTTYAHGETFKLDCKTQCVCENGRHACSSLCPKEQLPAPEDTISCRSPRLVEVPGHCCKMWLCENPTADVFATCHNSPTSPWTPCSHPCGLGISTRFTSTAAGCNQLSNLRLCENRKCESPTGEDNNNEDSEDNNNNNNNNRIGSDESGHEYANHLTKNFKDNSNNKHKSSQHHTHNGLPQQLQGHHHKHTIKKGHDCRHIERLGPARIRLSQCVSRKLYRPKVCGHCHHKTKCCVPSVSRTIQVELLCPLNAVDPISLVQRQLNTPFQQQQELQQLQFYGASTLTSLWDTRSLDAIDQEYFQSHQIHIENKFIAVEWILKCVCTESENCQRSANAPTDHSRRNDSDNDNRQYIEDYDAARDNDGGAVGGNNDKRNNENFNKINMQNDKNNKDSRNNNYNNNDDYNYFGLYDKINKRNFKRQNLQNIDDNTPDDNDDSKGDGDGDTSIGGRNRQTKRHNGAAKYDREETVTWSTSSLSSSSSSSLSDEIQPDIIPYPPPPFRANQQTSSINSNQKDSIENNSSNNSNNNSDDNTKELQQQTTAKRIRGNFQFEREQHRQQQQQYFYEQWLLQQQQQQRQQAFYEQLMVT